GILDDRRRVAFGGLLLAALMKPIAIVAVPAYGLWLWMRTSERKVAVQGTMAAICGLGLAYAPYWQGGKAGEPLRRIAWRMPDALPVGWLAAPTGHLTDQNGAELFARLQP